MKIVVTGGNGYIGSALKHRIDLLNNIEGIFITIDHVENEGYKFTDFSIDNLVSYFTGADIVVHLAAVRGGDNIESFNDNLVMTERIMIAMKQANVKRFIFMSSIAVYSDINLLPWNENQACTPVSLYGISKLACENICKYYSRQNNFDGIILRLAPVYGENDPNKRMIANFVRQAICGDKITVNGKSESRRDFIYRDDVIDALLHSIESQIKGVNIINIGSGCSLTNYEIATTITEAFGKKSKIDYLDYKSENMSPAYMDLNKAISLGYTFRYDMKSAMEEMSLVEGMKYVSEPS